MTSREVYKSIKENAGGPNESTSNSVLSAETNDEKTNRGFTESCPAVLEPSKDESRRSDERSKSLSWKTFTRSCPGPSSREVSTSTSSGSVSASTSHEEEQQRSAELGTINEQQTDAPDTNCCVTFMDCYKKYTQIIRDSWFIYVFQFFVVLLCASAITMGIIFFQSCEGDYRFTDPFITILMGIFGLLLIYKWLVKVCRQRSGQYYWNHEKTDL